MAPLIALVGGFAVARVIGLLGVDALDGWHPALRVALALMFLVTGIAHFAPPLRRGLIAMVPPLVVFGVLLILEGTGAL